MTRHDQPRPETADAVRAMLARARPDQIRRLLDDIRRTDRQTEARHDDA